MTFTPSLYLPSFKRSQSFWPTLGASTSFRRSSAKFGSEDCMLHRPHTGFSKKRLLSNTVPRTLATHIYTENPTSTLGIHSTVFRGTSFENRCLHLLEAHLGMVLQRVGGKEDGGVDLNGWWWLPDVAKDTAALQSPDILSPNDARTKDPSLQRIRVIAQCKAEKKKIGPKYVRELEGVAWRYMALEKDTLRNPSHESDGVSNNEASKETTPIVAVFLSESPFTKSTVLRAMSSQVPFLLIYVPPLAGTKPDPENPSESEEEIDSPSVLSPGSCIYNPALGASGGLFKGELEVRWCWSLPTSNPQPSLKQPSETDTHSSQSLIHGAPALLFRGRRLRGWVPPRLREFDEQVGKTF
ncbi:hypothetical protein GGU10DRAFT_363920 [Lentinula aff. detonsa]|uniref:Required for respiratory growth protein 7, mitochondrial n=1 Tax=Lentinula aff. detonsa TaxID=2804958 RepID=A0AA38KUP4_9AGAR|nr:hypothetical protein GGU10DRAFT_363920 [Lentinula aff. detonsa]